MLKKKTEQIVDKEVGNADDKDGESDIENDG
jgi:hypothetical protein